MGIEVSRHHLAWNKSNYKTPLERRYRQYRGMIVPDVANPWHKELHANMGQPRKPTPELMIGALSILSQADLIDPLDGLYAVSEFMLERDTRLSVRIGEHLLEQAVFLEAGLLNNPAICSKIQE